MKITKEIMDLCVDGKVILIQRNGNKITKLVNIGGDVFPYKCDDDGSTFTEMGKIIIDQYDNYNDVVSYVNVETVKPKEQNEEIKPVIKDAYNVSLAVTNDIMDNVISQFDFEGERRDIKVQIHPLISNVIFQRDKDIKEQERFKTLIQLSRVLDDENMLNVIKQLGYKLTV